MINTRKIAYNILNKTIADEAYANLLMREELEKIPSINRPFVSELVYGTLRNYDFLLYQVRNDIKDNTKEKLKNLLALALYERHFMNSKEYALVNEYVELVNNKYEKGFINAILRKNNNLEYATGKAAEAINASLPVWIYELLSKQYSKEELKSILNVYASRPDTYYRINPNKITKDELKIDGIKFIDERFFTSSKPLFSSFEFKKGYFYVQDINSGELVNNLDLKEDDSFLDMCSAPGSKLFNALEIVKDTNAYANDIYAHRVELIKKGSKRLGYNNVHYLNYDACILSEKIDTRFDKILLDAPCSGLGVLSRKPDIKFHITPNSLDELEKLQCELLESAYKILKNKGLIVYSTCTLNQKENTKQVNNFINKHSDLKLIKEKTIIKEGGDCFYFAKISRD